jgi:hypothetical protein
MPVSNNFIDHRTQALATVVLTRREDLLISGITDPFLDLLVQVHPEKARKRKGTNINFPFGCHLEGTGKPLDTPEEATAYLRAMHLTDGRHPRYCFPVLILVFSMAKDKGYYAWYAYPSFDKNEHPVLQYPAKPTCAAINDSTMDIIVQSVVNFFDGLYPLIVRDV